ncbi:SMP-30/gluconolactonase/LRE family protein [Dyadobacter sp. LHD-138]|uniref:SMP-30/gluconolactonase/LRE family protein n=1 Tax=Dyadobacter sp. LHD-138 TaxID=3071413 RepID=UPI0027E0A286|nr:SMP-30/gluconolactonase/LRE family protein [Dyadobacter sp. LHD-138]MDQ6477132.1 SMP-30/gluconolactonase/LRE family protein [Dyadobacter sp. LHD-138]
MEIAPYNQAQPASAGPLYESSVFTAAHSFTSGIEGPAVDRKGVLYAVNFEKQGTIGQVMPGGKGSIFVELPGGSIGNGIRFHSDGRMFIADYKNHNILQVNMASKQLSVYAHEPKMNQPNDIAIDDKNRLYASDPNWGNGSGNIWRIDTDGKVTLLEANAGTTNGIEVSPDNKTLYVNETVQRRVWAYDLAADGGISNKRLLIEFPDFGMDGMRCDIKGNLYITRHGKGIIVKVSPAGKVLREIQVGGKQPSNLAFGGRNGCTVYVTLQDNGNIEKFQVEDPGREWKMLKK